MDFGGVSLLEELYGGEGSLFGPTFDKGFFNFTFFPISLPVAFITFVLKEEKLLWSNGTEV